MLISWWPSLFCSRAVTRVLLAAVSVCVQDDLHLHSGVGFSLFAYLASLCAINLFFALILADNVMEKGHNSTVFDLYFGQVNRAFFLFCSSNLETFHRFVVHPAKIPSSL